MKEKVMHLFVTNDCDHDCPLCCNKQYDIAKIPVATVEELSTIDTLCITGGEPFLANGLASTIIAIKEQYPNIKDVYIYTSVSGYHEFLFWRRMAIIPGVTGINFSPKNDVDYRKMKTIIEDRHIYHKGLKSNRIYLFDEKKKEDVESLLKSLDIDNTEIILRKWQKEFVPNGGIFRRLPILLSGQFVRVRVREIAKF